MDIGSQVRNHTASQGRVSADRGHVEALSEAESALRRMRSTLGNQGTLREDHERKLAAMADNREKAKQQLYKAERELRHVVAMLQEVRLSLMGLRD